MISFTELSLSFWGYTLEMEARLLNMAPSKTVPQTPYEIWHGKPASYKYLRMWSSPAYVKRLTLVGLTKGVKPVGCIWVYKHKLGADGEVTAFEARLVAKGYTQRPGINFEETYPPVTEYIAASEAANKAIWMKNYIKSWVWHLALLS
ncbi:UNVERIFIED_CONTAM: Retrovirus-related Pol polyprotein from transposon RE2 [Sesamum calycinum]|uniref:Retrovirus-related Pol polyprotein from transposon RE2 n=1 Tax=Sesamum calycinum TaxID=2727403 RepID=A0AAW2SV48_9LAMI